jgi:hypothetical protein
MGQSRLAAAENETHATLLLQSSRLVDRTWGAYQVANSRLQVCKNKILELLRSAKSLQVTTVDGEDYAYVQSLLDAAIQLEATVDSDDILPYSSTWPVETIILLARDAKTNEQALLSLRHMELCYEHWLAVSNLLLRVKSPQFFVETFKSVRISHSITLVDQAPAQASGVFRDGLWGHIDQEGLRSVPSGFPPVCLYYFVRSTTFATPPESVLLANGPRPSRYVRVPTNRAEMWTRARPTWTFDDFHYGYQREYLAALTEYTAAKMNRVIAPVSIVTWKNRSDFVGVVASLLEQQTQALEQFLADSQSKLQSRLPELRVHLELEISDQRKDKNIPLPPIPSSDLTLNRH